MRNTTDLALPRSPDFQEKVAGAILAILADFHSALRSAGVDHLA